MPDGNFGTVIQDFVLALANKFKTIADRICNVLNLRSRIDVS